MGTEASKFAKPLPNTESSPEIVNIENELPFEGSRLKSTNNLPEIDCNSACGLTSVERALSSLDKNFEGHTMQQHYNSKRSDFVDDNVDKRYPTTMVPISVEQDKINLAGSQSNLPLMHENQSNLPLLLGNCPSNSPYIHNESKIESLLLHDSNSRSNSPPLINNILLNSPILLDKNQSKSSRSLSSNQFQPEVFSECIKSHESIQSCSNDLDKSYEKAELTEHSLFELSKDNTCTETVCSDLQHFTLSSNKIDVKEESKTESQSLSSNSPIILNESQIESLLMLDNKSRSDSPPYIDDSLPNSPILLDKNQSKSSPSLSSDQLQPEVFSECIKLQESVQSVCSDDLNKSEKAECFTEPSLFDLSEDNTDTTCIETVCSDLQDLTLSSNEIDIGEESKIESHSLSSVFLKEYNDYEGRVHPRKQLRPLISLNSLKSKSAEMPKKIKFLKKQAVPETLKEVEKLANRLCSNVANEVSNGLDVKPSVKQCLPQNPARRNKELSVISQQVILDRLECINNFIADLESCQFFDENVIFSLKWLKRSVSSLINRHNVTDDQDLQLALKLLLDSLPDYLQKEKENVTFKNSVPFCKTCNQNLSMNLLDVIKHLGGESHQQMFCDLEEKHQSVIPPSACENQSDINSDSIQVENNIPKCKPTLQKNHEGILKIIYDSKMGDFDMNLSLYICIACDYLINDEKIAKVHLTDGGHIVQPNTDWRFCSSCNLNIFCTTDSFVEHCSSLMHIEILKLCDTLNQNKAKTEKDIETCNSNEDKINDYSSSSSLSSRVDSKSLPIYKDTSFNESGGSSSDETDSTFPSKRIQDDNKEDFVMSRNDICKSVDAIVEEESSSDSSDDSCDQNDPCSNGSSSDSGPHFELMKIVLKKYLSNQFIPGLFGFYCDVCKAFTSDEQLWRTHLARASHVNHMDSLKYLGNVKRYNCTTCNIQLICDSKFFSWHKQTTAHKSIDARMNPKSKQEKHEERQKQKETRKLLKKNGVRLKGLRNTELTEKEILLFFKQFGAIKCCSMNKRHTSCKVVFENKINATLLLDKKFFYIKNYKVEATTLFGSCGKAKKKEKVPNKLTVGTIGVLVTQQALKDKITELMLEFMEQRSLKERQAKLIERDLYSLLPNSKVHFFGSLVTGVATKDSDFDIYIDFDQRSFFKDMKSDEQVLYLENLWRLLRHQHSPFHVKEATFGARVPIIRAQHKETDSPCDISCRNGLSVENSHLIREYLKSDIRVYELVAIIKWWMRENSLLGSNVFTSYATTWLVLFFLMSLPNPVVCSVSKLQTNCKTYSIANWDCRFTRGIDKCFKTANNQPVSELLVQFFQFYKNFSFSDYVLCPLNATVVHRKHFFDLDLPPIFNPYLYKMRMQRQPEALRLNSPICLQDPFDLSHNITKGVYGKELKKFTELCEQSEKLLQTNA